jgi:hypothetical protein
MATTTAFSSDKEHLKEVLDEVRDGKIQLPEFQRGWVWEDDRIRSLLASVSLGYPIGTLMLLQTGNSDVRFKARPVEGAPQTSVDPDHLLLDGQQRITALYQVLASGKVVQTQDDHKKPIKRWYYIDIMAALDPAADRDDAIISVPESRQVRTLQTVELDLSSEELEWKHRLFPLRLLFGDPGDLRRWLREFAKCGTADGTDERDDLMVRFETAVIRSFERYLVPTILLGKQSPKDAVCQVFEKVNTGGVSLTVFELLTATFAADEFNLREDWMSIHAAMAAKNPVLKAVESTDFLQTVTLLATHEPASTLSPTRPIRCGPGSSPMPTCVVPATGPSPTRPGTAPWRPWGSTCACTKPGRTTPQHSWDYEWFYLGGSNQRRSWEEAGGGLQGGTKSD